MYIVTIQDKKGQMIDRFCVSDSSSIASVIGKDNCLTVIEYLPSYDERDEK